jgi:hypothetical protein
MKRSRYIRLNKGGRKGQRKVVGRMEQKITQKQKQRKGGRMKGTRIESKRERQEKWRKGKKE